jgi:2-keto-4-pentenoate hydratase
LAYRQATRKLLKGPLVIVNRNQFSYPKTTSSVSNRLSLESLMNALSPTALLAAYDHAKSLTKDPSEPLTDFSQAQQIADQVAKLRIARGEKVLGYKIGFTNRSIWPLYGVSRPIWSPIYDTTVTQLSGEHAQVGLGRFVEPRLEPEIVIGLRSRPEGDSLAQVVSAIDWIAHGFEVVQSHYPNWKFTAAEAHACQGLHGALLIGPRTQVQADKHALTEALSGARLALCLEEIQQTAPKVAGGLQHQNALQTLPSLRIVEQGQGANVLDGPVQALAFLVKGLALEGKSLQPSAIVTTGTLTDAQVMIRGQRWRSHWLDHFVEPVSRDEPTNSHPAGPSANDDREKIYRAKHRDFFLASLALDVA